MYLLALLLTLAPVPPDSHTRERFPEGTVFLWYREDGDYCSDCRTWVVHKTSRSAYTGSRIYLVGPLWDLDHWQFWASEDRMRRGALVLPENNP